MHAALRRHDVIGKRHQRFVVAVVILNGDLRGFVVRFTFHINDVVEHFAVLDGVEMLDKAAHAALIIQLVCDKLLTARIRHGNLNAGVEKRLLSHPVENGIIIKFDRFRKNFGIRHKTDIQSVLLPTGTDMQEGSCDLSSFKPFRIHLAVMAVFDFRPYGKRIHDGSADAVQAAREFITARAEFSAGVKHGEYDLRCRNAKLCVHTARNTASIVLNGYASVRMKGHFYLRTNPRHRLIDGIVHDFIYEMMKTPLRGGADIHTGTLSNRFKSL